MTYPVPPREPIAVGGVAAADFLTAAPEDSLSRLLLLWPSIVDELITVDDCWS